MAEAKEEAVNLDGIQWVKNDWPEVPADGLYATHSGVLDILGFKLRCHQLNNGQRVFDADDVQAMFGAAEDDNGKQ